MQNGACVTDDIHGNPMSPEPYKKYLAENTPSKEDYDTLHDLMKDNDWIEQRTSTN